MGPQDTDTGQPFCAHTHGQAAAGPMDRAIRFSGSKNARRLRGFSGTIVGKSRSMPVQKNFFQPLCQMPCGGPLPPVLFPQGRHIRHCCLHSFPLCQSRRRQPLRTVLSPAFPPLIKGWICPHRIQATVFPHTKNFSQWQACPNLSSAAPVPNPILTASQQTTTPHTGAPRPQRARCGRR